MKNKILYNGIFILLLIVLKGIITISVKHYSGVSACPTIFSFPACYIILFCTILAIITHYFQHKSFYLWVGIPLAFAVLGTVLHSLGISNCPISTSNIPMCYISLGLFLGIFGFKILLIPKLRNYKL